MISRPVALVLLGVSLFLLILPLTVGKPGLPMGLKADEAAYYSMALSLAYDRDLELEVADVDRLFEEFHFRRTRNLIVMSDDGWRTLYYGKPYIYSLLAAPFARLFGANGMVFFNMLLFLGMVWLGTVYLTRHNDATIAAVFSAGFFLLSAGFSYVFWLQPEVLNMFLVTAALFLGLPRERRGLPPTSLLMLAASGAALAVATYNKPMIVALALPILVPPLLEKRGRRRMATTVAWAIGFVTALGLTAGLSTLLTGHPSGYFGQGVERQGVTVCEPGELPALEGAAAPLGSLAEDLEQPSTGTAPPASTASDSRNWSWLLRVPPLRPGELIENVGYFLFGRHTGLVLYFPFAALAVILFLIHARRSVERWLLLAGLAVVALFFLLFISWNWQGGGGFVANRYFVNVIPGFLFLVTRISPRWLLPAGYATAGLLIGPLVMSPFGLIVPQPTLQAHTRNFPLRSFPLELTLRNVPGYHQLGAGLGRLIVRQDQAVPRGEAVLWTAGGGTTKMLLLTSQPLERTVLRLRGFAPRSRLFVRLGDAREELDLAAGESRQVELTPLRPDRRRYRGGVRWNVYRLEVTSSSGAVVHWTRHRPPGACLYFEQNTSTEEPFYAGAELHILGPADYLAQDLYAVEWGDIDAPAHVQPGAEFEITTRITNRSAVPWELRGGARVNLSYRWLGPAGEPLEGEGLRTPLAESVPPGGEIGQLQTVRAPEQPGSYLLELDPVFEYIAWFSDRNGGNTRRVAIEVTDSPTGGNQR